MNTRFRILSAALTMGCLLPACGSGQCAPGTAVHGRALTYTIQPSIASSGTTLQIEVRFQVGRGGTERIVIPVQWAQQPLRAVRNLRAISQQTVISDSPDPATKIIHAPPNATVILAYGLVKDWTGEFTYPLQFHPVLMPEYVEFTGENALVYPSLKADEPVTVTFDWRSLPSTWVLATSFGAAARDTERCQTYSGTFRSVAEALFTAGEFRVHRFQIRNRPAVLLIRGAWTFTDEEAMAKIEKTVGVVRDFWHDDDFPYFLVTVKQFDTNKDQGDGSAFTNAFWIYMSRKDQIATYMPMLAHEAFHNWNPNRMGDIPSDQQGKIDWFKEGFTTYYAGLLLERAGATGLPAYLDDVNQDLRQYSTSDSPYVRGRIIALWADAQIRQDSKGKRSLDDVMFAMERASSAPLTEHRVIRTMDRYLSRRNRGVLSSILKHGAVPEPVGDLFGPCVRMSMEEFPTFDLGFDFTASRAVQRIVGVRDGGPAFAAGLRNGQKMTQWSVDNGHPEKLARFTVNSGSDRQSIQYYPSGPKVRAPQFHVTQTCVNPG